MKNIVVRVIVAAVVSSGIEAGGSTVSGKPTIVQNAEIREAERQDSTWTSENIQKNPYLFLQDQIANCDKLRAKIETQNITLTIMEKAALRKVEEAQSMIARYTKFLTDAKSAYKAANGKWPVLVNGYELGEDDFGERVADAMERVDLAQKEVRDNGAIAKKVSIRKGVLNTKKRDTMLLRMRLVQQAEQMKTSATLAELGALNDVLGTIKDMMTEVDGEATKLSVEDMAAEDPNDKRKIRVNAFLND